MPLDSFPNAVRASAYTEAEKQIATHAPTGSMGLEDFQRTLDALETWCNAGAVNDRRTRWVLDGLDWSGVFRDQPSVSSDILLELIRSILAYRDPPKLSHRTSGRYDDERILVPGRGAGKLRLVEREADLARGDIPPDALLVSPEIWRTPYPAVAGLILTERVSLEGAHHLGWFEGLRSPIVCLPALRKRLLELAAQGAWCDLEAIEYDIRFVQNVPQAEALEIERNKRPPLDLQVSDPPLALVTQDHPLQTDVGAVGHKFVGLLGVDTAPDRIAIPSSYERLFIERAGVANQDEPAMAEALMSLGFEAVREEMQTLFEALVAALPVHDRRIRLRSSSNYEDLVGAGVTESATIECTGPEALFEGMRQVYVTQFSERACQVRRMFSVAPDTRRMAILVHASLDQEDWNGVARVTSAVGGHDVRIFGLKGSGLRVTECGSEDPLDLNVSATADFLGDVERAPPVANEEATLVRDLIRALMDTPSGREGDPFQAEWIASAQRPSPRFQVTVLQATSLSLRRWRHQSMGTDPEGRTHQPDEILAKGLRAMALPMWLNDCPSSGRHHGRFIVYRQGERRVLVVGRWPDISHLAISTDLQARAAGWRDTVRGYLDMKIQVDQKGLYIDRVAFVSENQGDYDADPTRVAQREHELTLALQEPEVASLFRPWTMFGERPTWWPHDTFMLWKPGLPNRT